MEHLGFDLSLSDAEPLRDDPGPKSKAEKKQDAKQHAKQYRKARRGERRSRTVSKPAAKKKARAKAKKDPTIRCHAACEAALNETVDELEQTRAALDGECVINSMQSSELATADAATAFLSTFPSGTSRSISNSAVTLNSSSLRSLAWVSPNASSLTTGTSKSDAAVMNIAAITPATIAASIPCATSSAASRPGRYRRTSAS